MLGGLEFVERGMFEAEGLLGDDQSRITSYNVCYTKLLRGHNWAVFASKGGAPSNPDWYYNVVANPDVEIEVGTETVAARVV